MKGSATRITFLTSWITACDPGLHFSPQRKNESSDWWVIFICPHFSHWGFIPLSLSSQNYKEDILHTCVCLEELNLSLGKLNQPQCWREGAKNSALSLLAEIKFLSPVGFSENIWYFDLDFSFSMFNYQPALIFQEKEMNVNN